jgi:hypothetical protein
MIVTIKEEKNENILPFPKLMISDMGDIILFHKQSEGISLLGGAYMYENLDMQCFKDFKGEITIKQ